MAIPAWKLALLEKKKKQEEEAKVKEAQAEEAKLASLPAWKRAIALREKQAKDAPQGGTANHSITPPTKRSNKWQVAVERVKGPDSPILPKWKGASSSPAREVVANPVIASSNKFAGFSKPEVFTGSPKPGRPAQLAGSAMSPKPGRSAGSSKPELVFAGHPKPAAKIAANTTTKTENKVAQRWTHKNSSSSSASAAPLSKASPAGPPITGDDDPSLAAMPAWKRALLLKKRQQQQKPVEDSSITSKHNGGEDEPDSAAPASTPSVPTPSAPKAHQPEVVNKRVDTGDVEAPSNRLVEQEGKTLRAPVYKEVDEWANVKEEDDKFQSLPPWKQALIKRRRVDIAKRSGLPVPESPTPPTAQGVSSPLTKKAAFEKKSNSRSSNSPKKPAKTVNEQKGKVGRRDLSRNRTKNESPTPTKAVDSKPVKKAPVHKKSEDLKPARKAPQPPPAKDPMFTYNFSKSKSTHHTLDTGGTSSDSTDSELEDAVVTNLDESSDEGDSGIVLQRYTPSKPSSSSPNIGQKSPSLGQKSHSDTSVDTPSVLSKPGKKKRGMRRVSWSDTHLVMEHFYPKYDYSDYEEAEKDVASNPASTENSGLSHRLHPSLRPSNASDPYAYGFSSTGSPRSPSSDNSLSTFVPKALSAYSQAPQISSSYSDRNQVAADDNSRRLEEVTPEEETDDFYADLTSNTAALLW